MKRCTLFAGIVSVAALAGGVRASDADSSATAGRGWWGPGAASATAHYSGDVGFARTDARSGRVNLARGVAVGYDENGLSLSVSTAVAPRLGPALATNFNLSIGRDGQVAGSTGLSVADGRYERSATAGGGASAGRFDSAASSVASGQTDRFGRVDTVSNAYHSGGGPVGTAVLARGPHAGRIAVPVHRSSLGKVKYVLVRP